LVERSPMGSTVAKSPKRMGIASGAILIPRAGYEAWFARASAAPGLNDVERKVLDAIQRRLNGDGRPGQRRARHCG
jgi:hypothetical protein